MTGSVPFGAPVPPSFGPGYPPGPKPSRAGIWPVALVGVVAVAALIVGIVALNNAKRETVSPPQPTDVASAEQVLLFDDEGDRALCLAIGPLMRESEDTRNAFQGTGPPNSPERNAAMPKFISDSKDWAHRVQKVLNEHQDPPRFLGRLLQRYIDDALLYVLNISPDRAASKYEISIYDLSIMDYGGPVGRCGDLDAGWWN